MLKPFTFKKMIKRKKVSERNLSYRSIMVVETTFLGFLSYENTYNLTYDPFMKSKKWQTSNHDNVANKKLIKFLDENLNPDSILGKSIRT